MHSRPASCPLPPPSSASFPFSATRLSCQSSLLGCHRNMGFDVGFFAVSLVGRFAGGVAVKFTQRPSGDAEDTLVEFWQGSGILDCVIWPAANARFGDQCAGRREANISLSQQANGHATKAACVQGPGVLPAQCSVVSTCWRQGLARSSLHSPRCACFSFVGPVATNIGIVCFSVHPRYSFGRG